MGDSKGLNLMLKVVSCQEDAAASVKTWEVVAGDTSGSVIVSLRNERHAQLCSAGASIRVQNAHAKMLRRHIRIIVDKWAMMRASDSPLAFEVNTSNDISAIVH